MNMTKIFLLLIVIVLLASPSLLAADDWTPRRIVGMSYPRLAEQSSTQGTVHIECILDETGEVLSARIVSVSGPKPGVNVLAKAAQNNAVHWKFLRASKSGISKSQNRVTLLIYEFRLEGVRDKPESEFIFELPNEVHLTSQAQHWMP